jgi:hypothetical protein
VCSPQDDEREELNDIMEMKKKNREFQLRRSERKREEEEERCGNLGKDCQEELDERPCARSSGQEGRPCPVRGGQEGQPCTVRGSQEGQPCTVSGIQEGRPCPVRGSQKGQPCTERGSREGQQPRNGQSLNAQKNGSAHVMVEDIECSEL